MSKRISYRKVQTNQKRVLHSTFRLWNKNKSFLCLVTMATWRQMRQVNKLSDSSEFLVLLFCMIKYWKIRYLIKSTLWRPTGYFMIPVNFAYLSASDIKNTAERFCVEESFILLRKTKTLPNNLISCRFCNEESSIFFRKTKILPKKLISCRKPNHGITCQRFVTKSAHNILHFITWQKLAPIKFNSIHFIQSLHFLVTAVAKYTIGLN